MRNRFFAAFAAFLVFPAGGGSLFAQAQSQIQLPDQNPESNMGGLKEQVETGGSYSAHSGNMTRSVVDLQVPNAPGVYGLDFRRYYNSLRVDQDQVGIMTELNEPDQTTDFGSPGWSHSWSWVATYNEFDYLEDIQDPNEARIYLTQITVTFPDGHSTKYSIKRYGQANWQHPSRPYSGPPYYPDETNWDPPGSPNDHLKNMATDGSNFWIYRADGGAVHFVKDSTGEYKATKVFDPYGLLTRLEYEGGYLSKVIQDGGRQLTIDWAVQCPGAPQCWSGKVISKVRYEGGGAG